MHKPTSSISAAESRTYTISELAREFGVTPRALRFYEDKDMLHPARDGMMRLYSNRDRARLTIIVRLKRLGLPLADIREILDLYALNDGKRAQTRMMLEKFRKQARELEVQRQDIDTALTELYKGIDWLQGIVENPGPSEESKRQAAAYEQVARKQLDEV
ncbi:transcriptional regulator, MerR family [Hyphomonas neptunium ATCC 15444]|jgi:DNA-binding transcriptional MerR regulator|uniref:Transcriptional regulator, MerR family n=2 Tax=Hyphomonas TaxID=85 RepID=Q0C4E7_HYPNA|nr:MULTISPECIES: MerR family DNA-binding transcriptional regulator [Hyphomonas]ABI77368.1 transcriptional regulator, MerR family [Hyphomonas neptunium ATCC 15444]KCZ96392.1 MerR family transcriptional regulator [Hyphomonas hirschiana VP5]OZB17727.1 MAG: transcriptional regulator [Hyphomonas sp. 34-62-18]PKP81021.1 MAG: transcriptional regulator [Alphaproteobacteria bacterium HGW-Alphaproteobacteria-18]